MIIINYFIYIFSCQKNSGECNLKMELPSSSICNDRTPNVQGYILFNQNVSVFDFGNIIVSKNYKDNDQVRILSGGTLSHIDYVGDGMLTASIQGQNGEVPSPNIILRTIRELSLNHIEGILIIVPASSTNVLSFGLATERALNDDLKVMLLTVSDNPNNYEEKSSGRECLSGIIMIHKIAGALAVKNKSLTVIYEYCNQVIGNLISVATNVQATLRFESCTYCKKCKYKKDIERPTKLSNSKKTEDIIPELANNLVNNIFKSGKFMMYKEDSCVLFFNNAGALKRTDEYVFISEVWKCFKKYEVNIIRIYIDNYFHINDDIDLSISMLKIFDKELITLLDAPCSTVGWKQVFQYESVLNVHITAGCLKRKCRLSPPSKGPKLRDKPSNIVQLCLQFACNALISCEKMLNKIDSEKGDGDTGTRLRNVAEVLNKRACNRKLIFLCPFTFFLSLSKILENAVGGTMGCIYSILFEAAANKFGDYKEDDEVTYQIWLEALENSCKAIEKYGNVKLGDKTMYDPLIACANTIKLYININDPIEAFGRGVSKAEDVATKTVKSGCKFPDAGAHAVGIWMRAIYEGVKLRYE
ncbi:uncharacterized protein LOC143195008 [Rhynchophorus ferrugineus]|uniref:uncharacterized protein LOC143195008 n=1 Tax=Rhynchophorus ferrugineus TaxID=354439 RepID=UPI003FCE302F